MRIVITVQKSTELAKSEPRIQKSEGMSRVLEFLEWGSDISLMDEIKGQKNESSSPSWVITFADLMSLLLTFFILLLSFGNTDVRKFQMAAGSIRSAFGGTPEFRYEKSSLPPLPFWQGDVGVQRNWMGEDFAHPVISFGAQEICELEQQSKAQKRSQVEYLKHEMAILLQKEFHGYEGIDIGVQGSQLRIRLEQDHFFKEGSALFESSKDSFLKKLMGLLSHQRASIGITNYSDFQQSQPSKGQLSQNQQQQSLQRWKLSVDRSLVLASVTRQMEGAEIHEISVESLLRDRAGDDGADSRRGIASRREVASGREKTSHYRRGVSQDIIDMFIDFNVKDTQDFM